MDKIEKLILNLRSAEYKFAKTMPNMPHYYTVGDKWRDRKEFIWTCHAINEFGVLEFYMKKPRKYFYIDGWRYWIMSDNPDDCKILNRERETIRSPRPIPEEFL